MPRYIIISMLSCMLFLQCRTLGKPDEKLALDKNEVATNKIIFLTYRVTFDSTKQEYNFQPINKVFAAGVLNPNTLAEQPYVEPGYFYCEVTGSAPTQYNKVEDPLNIIREYPSEDASGKLAKLEIHQPEGEITIRFQYTSGVKNLLIKIPLPHSKRLKTIYYAQL